jgi:hypothetical protein
MTSTPHPSNGDPDDVQDQDAEPTMNTTSDERPDAQVASDDDGGSTEDVI